MLLLAFTLMPQAQAATKTITLSNQGESPASVSISVGDTVTFVNSGNSTHQVDSGAGWTFHKAIAPGASATTPAFTRAGSFSYTDKYALLALPQSGGGTITVTAVKPSPTPTPTPAPTTSPTPKPSASPKPSPSATTSASAAPTVTAAPAATGGTGVAPGLIIGGTVPTLSPSATGVPGPDIAGPLASDTGAPVADIAYGGKNGIVQGSPHRYGLPALLAVVGIVGVLSLLVRFLLSQPEARS